MRVPTAPWGQEVALVKRKRHTPEQIIRKLREAEGLLEEGAESPRGDASPGDLGPDLPVEGGEGSLGLVDGTHPGHRRSAEVEGMMAAALPLYTAHPERPEVWAALEEFKKDLKGDLAADKAW